MRAKNSNLLEFLNSINQLHIPVFQRPYSWGEKECRQLIEDVFSIAKNENIQNHFLGFITCIHKEDDSGYYLIDGQQRVVTLSLLLAAMNKITEGTGAKNDASRTAIKNKYLLSNGDLKLILNPKDMPPYISIIANNQSLFSEDSCNINNNYEFFIQTLSSLNIDLNSIFKALQKLEIIEILLTENQDNPQLIFDSLNATGIRLSEIEKIKNYILMGINTEDQHKLYETYWQPMEFVFENGDSQHNLEDFIQYYLSIFNENNTNQQTKLYDNFVEFFNNKLLYQSRNQILNNIYKYSTYYQDIIENAFDVEEIRGLVEEINFLNAKAVYPFLMEVMDDYKNDLLNDELLVEILKNVKVFIQKFDGKDSATLSQLSKNINKMLALKDFVPKLIDNKDKEQETITINDLIQTA